MLGDALLLYFLQKSELQKPRAARRLQKLIDSKNQAIAAF
jgi:hypothetical protein